MANRKVLINRHSTKNQAPVASEMFHGEIAVSHPSDLSATTIWTLNNNTMVPFASCAMTMQMIDNAITAADVTYDVKAAEGDAHVEVVSDGTEKAKVFTVSSKDVQSKAAFDTYSAATDATIKNNYNTLSGAIDDVLSIITTSITGDSIIDVQPTTSGAGTYRLSHKKATAVTGFKKLETDAYGHVTGSTPVAASDIKALGFEDSAWTEEKITSAITALDVTDAAVAGQYVSTVSETDGKISVSRADVSKAPLNDYAKGTDATAVAATDTINQAISKLENQIDNTKAAATTKVEKDADANHLTLASSTAADGSVTYTIGENDIASKTDLDAVSGIVDTFSAATVAEFTSAFTAIQGMDKDADAVAGQVVTTVAQTDGKVTETKASVKDLQLGGYAKDTTATGAIAATDTIKTALSKLENIVAANEISNADGSINVTSGTTGTDINVNIKTGEKVLAKDGAAGLYTDLDLVKITTGLPETVKERYQLLATDDSQIGVNIDVPKDSHIVSINYITTGEHAQNLEYVYIDASGQTQTTYVDMSELVLEAEFASGVTVTDHIAHGVVDPASEKDSNNDSFLTVGADGFKVDGIKDEIDAKVNALDVTGDTAVAGQYVAAIEQTDGVVAVKTRANVSEAVLTNYVKGSDASAVAATDSVNAAISKLENQVDAAKAAATTKVVEGTDAGNNMTITPTTSATDGSVTYTVDLTDVASKDALDAEIAARKDVDGQAGQTYAANTGATYITGATSLNDADVKLDAALKAVSDKVNAAKVTEGSSVKNYVALTLDTATTAGTTALTINDSALKTKIDEINSAITAETKARQDAIADLDSTAQTSGSGYFLTSVQLADGKITAATQNDKVNSASTAAHADAATQVDQKLTFADDANDVEYDGSRAETITFGTACTSTGITNERSMSITKGVVDVEIIDCGEY